MSKGEAFCVEAGRNITILEARTLYFAQDEPRLKLTFQCGDPRCRAVSKAAIVGANYHRDDALEDKKVSPYFRENPHHAHVAGCTWIGEAPVSPDASAEKQAGYHNTRTSAAAAECGMKFVIHAKTGKSKGIEPPVLSKGLAPGTTPAISAGEGRAQPRRPETSRFLAVVAMNHLRFTDAQRKAAPLFIGDIARGTFYTLCLPLFAYHPKYQKERIYFGRCGIVALDNVFMIKLRAKIALSGKKEERTAEPQIVLSKKWLRDNDAELADVLAQLVDEKAVAWCYLYAPAPPVDPGKPGRTIARFNIESPHYIAVVPENSLTEDAPDDADQGHT